MLGQPFDKAWGDNFHKGELFINIIRLLVCVSRLVKILRGVALFSAQGIRIETIKRNFIDVDGTSMLKPC